MPKALVTGASSGIGKAIAFALAQEGWEVLAGIRSSGAARALEGLSGITPISLDVADPQCLARLPERLEGSLDALVNNAGVVVPGPLEILPLDALRRQLEVNLVGQVGVTQAALPSLRASRGRIVFISSVSGLIAFPLLGAYAASKHGIEAVGDAFRRELHPWGIEVSLVEPGPIRSRIWEKTRLFAQEEASRLPPEKISLYNQAIEGLERGVKRAEEGAEDPRVVVEAVLHALTAATPRTRYFVGPRSKWRTILAKLLPDRWLDVRLRGF